MIIHTASVRITDPIVSQHPREQEEEYEGGRERGRQGGREGGNEGKVIKNRTRHITTHHITPGNYRTENSRASDP